MSIIKLLNNIQIYYTLLCIALYKSSCRICESFYLETTIKNQVLFCLSLKRKMTINWNDQLY